MSWTCGGYSQTNPPPDFGAVVSDASDLIGQEPNGGTTQSVYQAVIVFSEQVFTYNTNGNVTGTATNVYPAADVSGESEWNGSPFEAYSGDVSQYCNANVYIYGKVKALPGAPTNAAIPLLIRFMGYASASTPAGGGSAPSQASAYAWSSFQVDSSVLYSTDATAVASSVAEPYVYNDYDQTISATVYVTNLLFLQVLASGSSSASIGNVSPGIGVGVSDSDAGYQAFADPMVEIDPSYPFKDFFELRYGNSNDSIVFSPSSPMVLCLTNLTAQSAEVLLTCPSNNVYEIQANSDLTSTNWTSLAVVTNLAGSAVSYTDAELATNAQRFYRAAALRKVQ